MIFNHLTIIMLRMWMVGSGPIPILELVPAFLCSLYLTFYKTDISLRPTASAGPKGVRLRGG